MSEDRTASAAVPQPPGGHELLRAAIVEGLHVSLRRAFNAPEVWKIRLADLEASLREEALVEKVRALFEAGTTRSTDFAKTNAIS